MAIYTPSVPQGNQQISATQAPILGNFEYLQATLTKDHEITSLNSATAIEGYHKIVHLTTQATPALIASITQVYTRVAGSDTQLFVMNSAGQISRLTGHSTNPTGHQYLGGVILQWGLTNVNFKGSPTVISYNIPFPNATLSVVTTPVYSTDNSPASNNIFVKSVGLNNFTVVSSSESAITQTYWTAVGY